MQTAKSWPSNCVETGMDLWRMNYRLTLGFDFSHHLPGAGPPICHYATSGSALLTFALPNSRQAFDSATIFFNAPRPPACSSPPHRPPRPGLLQRHIRARCSARSPSSPPPPATTNPTIAGPIGRKPPATNAANFYSNASPPSNTAQHRRLRARPAHQTRPPL